MVKSWNDGLPSFKDINDLPVLDAVINEALRLHPAAPASLPRETPAGGRTLNGVHVPAEVSQRDEETPVPSAAQSLTDPFVFRPSFRCSATPLNAILRLLRIPILFCQHVGTKLMRCPRMRRHCTCPSHPALGRVWAKISP